MVNLFLYTTKILGGRNNIFCELGLWLGLWHTV